MKEEPGVGGGGCLPVDGLRVGLLGRAQRTQHDPGHLHVQVAGGCVQQGTLGLVIHQRVARHVVHGDGSDGDV